MKYPSDKEAKELILKIGKDMARKNFVSANDGNITVRVGDNVVWATPTGVNKGDLTEDMLIKIDFDGNILEGTWKITSEIPMHLQCYKTDNKIMSTCHAHCLNLSTFACAGLNLDLPTTPASCCIAGTVPVAPYKMAGTQDLADSVIPFIEKGFKIINLGNHGPIAVGYSPIEAWYNLDDAESAAALAMNLITIGKLRPLSMPQLKTFWGKRGFDVPEARRVAAPETTNNQEEAASLAEFCGLTKEF